VDRTVTMTATRAASGVGAMTDGSADFRGAAVLVVEDEPGIAGFVRRGLTFEGFEVRLATDGRAGLAALLDRRPDVLVLDLMLPHVDGLEVLRRLRAAERDEGLARLPVILLTARDAVADRVGGLGAGADDYLVKPFAFEELAARVRALLRRAGDARALDREPAAPCSRSSWGRCGATWRPAASRA
jgi:two-component system, OmpR family, response regulator MprA